MNKEEFVALYEKFLDGKCTAEEIDTLQSHHDEEIPFTGDDLLSDPSDTDRLYHILKDKIRNSIPDQQAFVLRGRFKLLKIAAVILVIISAAISFMVLQKPAADRKAVHVVKNKGSKIIPGGNKAYLTTADGSVITLDGLKNGRISLQNGIEVNKINDGLIRYNKAAVVANNGDAVDYHTITIPRGGQYQLVLSDGTKVWMNSASTLKYPVSFAKNERIVRLTGEAYFEVAKDKAKPFKVSVDDLDVKVLGTHFNVMAYKDENAIRTTLLEGSVQLSTGNRQVMLKPGQQGMLSYGATSIDVRGVDAEEAVAWKEGYFVFDNEDIHTIMKRIARWYDVEVVFPQNFKRANFGGTVSRFKDVAQVLKSLELTGSVHFQIKERRIIVMP
ncbi:FecR family protein [Pedobacter miscanthi]|uniref:FecR family protein n=1 Tax=Pedobacter miscanthi TaxID=2259170 RepID=UPI002930B264|nr:FecR domain-containing protein [Pedobacter miscanthi]